MRPPCGHWMKHDAIVDAPSESIVSDKHRRKTDITQTHKLHSASNEINCVVQEDEWVSVSTPNIGNDGEGSVIQE